MRKLKMRTKSSVVFVMLFVLFALTGCSTTEAIYDEVMGYELERDELKLMAEGRLGVRGNDVDIGSDSDENSKNTSSGFKSGAYTFLSKVSQGAKKYAIYIIPISIVIGFIMIRLAPKAIKVRRTAWIFFIIGIPVVTIVVIYGSAILADTFN